MIAANEAQFHRVKAAVQALGPQLLGDAMPPVRDMDDLTDDEVIEVAQEMGRRFFRDMVKQHEAAVAAEQAAALARKAAIRSVDDDKVIPDA